MPLERTMPIVKERTEICLDRVVQGLAEADLVLILLQLGK